MMTISTLPQAAAGLQKLTGREWSVHDVLETASQKLIPLQAKVRIDEGDLEKVNAQSLALHGRPTTCWRNADGHLTCYVDIIPMEVWMLMQDGVATIKHPADRHHRSWPIRTIRVELDQVVVDSRTLTKLADAIRANNVEVDVLVAGRQSPRDAFPRRVPASQAQDEAILRWLKSNNVDPQAYPRPPAGKACPVTRDLQEALGYSVVVIEKALQRLRAEGQIRYR